MTSQLILVGIITLTASLLFPFVVKPLLEKLGVIDVPNERSTHVTPVLRGMGIATLFAMIVGYLATYLLRPSTAGTPGDFSFLVIVALVAVVSSALGLAEDLKGLRVLARSIAQLSIALGALIAFVSLTGASWLWIPYGVLFLSSYINVANFMDGVDGISGMHGVIAGATFALAGALSGQIWLVFSGLILAAAFLGFLPWNFLGAGAFLGDVGSYLLGGAVAATSIGAAISGVPWLATIAPMILYFGDTSYTLIVRMRRGEKWYEAHKEHVFERLNQLGYSHVQVTLIVSGLTIVGSALGIASFWVDGFGWWMLLAGGLALTMFYLLLPRLLPARHARVAQKA